MVKKKVKITSRWTKRIRKIKGINRSVKVRKVRGKYKIRLTKYKKPKMLKSSIIQKAVKNHSIKKDKQRLALHPGKRISKRGNIYYEHRVNRSDKSYKRRL